jgi:hypothetical protein
VHLGLKKASSSKIRKWTVEVGFLRHFELSSNDPATYYAPLRNICRKLSTSTTQQLNYLIMASLKGPGEAQQHDGSALRIAIVHARWNMTVCTHSASSYPTKRMVLTSSPPDHRASPRRGKSEAARLRRPGAQHRHPIRAGLLVNTSPQATAPSSHSCIPPPTTH